MIISRNWLQNYFKEQLPKASELSDLLSFHSFEVEGVEEKDGDALLDVKVLPDRAHYALSHLGVAREISFITGMRLIEREAPGELPHSKILELAVEDERCLRSTKIVLQNVENTPSPEWLVKALAAIGQRSISLIVDVTNYVMFDMGQPLHAFDLDKLAHKDGKVKLAVKKAKAGEKITLLGAREVELDSDTLVFVDAFNNDLPLDIAGIKGGVAAEVTMSTKNIILLSDNFDPAYIRKTSTKYGIKTDAVKRFENGIVRELTVEGLAEACRLISSLSKGAQVEGVLDYYPQKSENAPVSFSRAFVTSYLGVEVPESEIDLILSRLECRVTKNGEEYSIVPPYYRKDMRIAPDVCEEIGRIFGYEKIPATLPSNGAAYSVNKKHYYSEKIREYLAGKGYSEVLLYSLVAEGVREVTYPIASDKKALRTNLTDGVVRALDMNEQNAPLLGLKDVKIFEIGNVFREEGEHTSLAIGITHAAKRKGASVKVDIETIREDLLKELGVRIEVVCTEAQSACTLLVGKEHIGEINREDGVLELNLDKLLAVLPEPPSFDLALSRAQDTKYAPVSVYPFAVRDVAVFVPKDVKPEQIEEVLRKHAGELLARVELFDVFSKKFSDGTEKTSYAYRAVLQSDKKTLTDQEITAIMDAVYAELKGKGWEVR